MPVTDREKQAERLTRRFFEGNRSRVTYEDVRRRLGISNTTYYNYSAYMQDAGLVRSVHSATGDRKNDLVITGKGQEVLNSEPEPVKRGPKSTPKKVLTPQELQRYVDEYNSQNPAWPFELAPKGFKREGVASH